MKNENFPIKMTPDDWEGAYEKEQLPHWADYLEPSPLSKKLLEDLPKKENNKILEIGTGNGRDSIFFAQNNNEVAGIDIAQGAVKIAKENAKKAGVAEKINFTVGKAEELEFAKESFDAVYSISVLHSTILPDSAAEIARVLKPGGKAIIYLYEMTESGGKKYWFWKKEEIEKIFSQNKLTIEDKWGFWDDRHEKEKTKVLIYKLRKISTE